MTRRAPGKRRTGTGGNTLLKAIVMTAYQMDRKASGLKFEKVKRCTCGERITKKRLSLCQACATK